MAKKAAPSPKTRRRTTSDEHKAALAEGREQGSGWHGATWRRWSRIVRSGAESGRRRASPSAWRPSTSSLPAADPLNRLHLVQERLDLERELASSGDNGADLEEREGAFVEVAAAYGERKGLTYEAWRSVGVAPRVLKAAGIGREQ